MTNSPPPAPYVPGPNPGSMPPPGYPPMAAHRAPTPPPKSSNWKPLLFGAGGLLVGLILGAMCGGAVASGDGKTPAAAASPVVTTVYVTAPGTPAATPPATTTAPPPPATTAAAPPPAATTAAAAAGPRTSFGDGTYEVNVDIAPGTYKTTVPQTSRNCYWQRSKDISGDFDSILANANSKPGSPVTVKILKSDVGFTSNGCGTWTKTA